MRNSPFIKNDRRIVITGLGTINPLASDVPTYWQQIKAGASCMRILQNTDLSKFHIHFGGEIDLPDNARDYFSQTRMIKRLDPNIIYAQIAGIQALRDSGLDMDDPALSYRSGSIIGTGAGGIQSHLDNIYHIKSDDFNYVSPFYLISAIPSTATSFFAKEANLKGPIFAVNSACAAANHAFGLSAMLIKTGMADVMFAGGTECALNKPGIIAFGNIHALSTRNDTPNKASRPFDRDRDGFVMGEGAGILCLEELKHAQARGAKIYGELTGFGFSSDAEDLVAPHPEAEGAIRAINAAIDMAGLKPTDIGLVNAHGTSTPIGDIIESKAINRVFGDYGAQVMVHSTKSMIGHLLGAASAVEALAALLVFKENIVHANINFDNLDPEINLNIVKENADGSQVDHILSNAFGFGGMNACVILSRFKD